LAEIEQVKPPTMVRIVQGLVDQRLATSRVDREDARKIEISATARGQALMQKARMRRVDALARMLQQKSDTERQKLRSAVEILRSLRTQTSSPTPDPNRRTFRKRAGG